MANITGKGGTLLDKLQKAADRRSLRRNSEESLLWYKNNVQKTIGKERAQKELILQQPRAQDLGSKIPMGKMYTFGYDAKNKDKLPYWDRFPLIFYVGPAKNGFYGINLHYLSPRWRAILFDALITLQNNPKYSQNTKLKLTYDVLRTSQNLRYYKPCFKHYLAGRMETKPVEIDAEQWETALFLPTADFGRFSMSQVWSFSVQEFNKK